MYTNLFGILSVIWLPVMFFSRDKFKNHVSLNKIIAYQHESQFDLTECLNPYMYSGGYITPAKHGFTHVKIEFSINNISYCTVLNKHNSFTILPYLYEHFSFTDSWMYNAYVTDKDNKTVIDVTDEILKYAGPHGDFFNVDFDSSCLFPNFEPGYKLKIVTNDISYVALHDSLHEIDIASNSFTHENDSLKQYGLKLLKKVSSNNSFECI
tara:strand:+ start:2772 stop:3401 length:630 start_codon:yes stop_codon:yes gene_type:complete